MPGWPCWILSTRPHSIGTVTAGTKTQLKARTWAGIRHWLRLCITAHLFEIGAETTYRKGQPDTWKLVAQTCKAQNAQSFAGPHARQSTSWYLPIRRGQSSSGRDLAGGLWRLDRWRAHDFRLANRNASVLGKSDPLTGYMSGKPLGAVAWTGSIKITVEPLRTSTSIRWCATSVSSYAVISSGKQIQRNQRQSFRPTARKP